MDITSSVAVGLVTGMARKFFSLGAKTDLLAFIIQEISRSEDLWLGVRSLSAVDAILEAFVLSKARITFPKLDVRDEGIDLVILADGQTVE